MRHSLLNPRKFTAAIVLGGFLLGPGGFALESVAEPSVPPVNASALLESANIENIQFDPKAHKPLEVAHHGGEGAPGASGAIITGAAAIGNLPGNIAHVSLTDSMWANILLSLAYQRDPEIRRLARKLKHVDTFTTLWVMGVSALGLAASISSLNDIGDQNIDVTPAHHTGDSDHVHIPAESRTPSTLGIISSGATIGTIGLRSLLSRRISKKISARQKSILEGIEGIIHRLEDGGSLETAKTDLAVFIGPHASQEFIDLWRVTHTPR